MSEAALVPLNLMAWIEKNRDDFPKPVGNKVIWKDGDFIAFVSGGNSRNDFHIAPCDEIFVQVVGDIRVDFQIDGERVINTLAEGEILRVPAGTPHAPRRPEGTWGFIVEATRKAGELDGFAWHCEGCNQKLHSVQFQLADIEKQFAAALREFDADEARRTCPSCGEVLEVYAAFTMESQRRVGSERETAPTT